MSNSTASRPNFFLLLGLQPGAAWDQAAFEQALRKKRTEWSRQSAGVARKALTAKQNLALIPKIQEVMTDPRLRAREARAAREELDAARRSEYEQFEKQLAFLNARETATQEEIDKFIAAFQHLHTPQEIKNRIQVKIKVPASPDSTPPLDASVAKRITDLLQFLHHTTFYELLKCSPQTATSEIHRAAEALYAHLVRLPPTAEVTARMELAGLARDIFQSDEMRARYDAYVRHEALDRLLGELDTVMQRSAEGELHPKQVTLFLMHARREGWSEREALLQLKEHARLRKWIVTLPATSSQPGEQLVLCPNCKHPNRAGQRVCSSCRFALVLECPRCGVLVSSDAATCVQCGFPVGNRFLVDRLLEELSEAIKEGESETADELLLRIEQAWQPGTQDKRSLQLAGSRMELQRLLYAQQRAQQDVQEHLDTLDIYEVVGNGQRAVRIDWAQVGSGKVMIIRSTQDLQQVGGVVPLTQLQQTGTLLEDRGNYTLDSWRPAELAWYTPVVVVGKNAYLGRSHSYCCIEQVSNVQYQHLSTVLRLRWQWPEQSKEVLVSYSNQKQFQHHDGVATTCVVSREEYDRRGYYDLQGITTRDGYLLISATLLVADQRVTSEGVNLTVRLASQMIMTYAIKQATLWRSKRILQITIDPPGPLPALLLICKQGGLPLKKTDGVPFQRIGPDQKVWGSMQVELAAQPLPRETFGKLFLEDEALYSEWIVHHPGEQSMRLS